MGAVGDGSRHRWLRESAAGDEGTLGKSMVVPWLLMVTVGKTCGMVVSCFMMMANIRSIRFEMFILENAQNQWLSLVNCLWDVIGAWSLG